MGRRWWHAIAGLGLAGLMACGQGPATVAVRSLDEPTPTAAATGRGAATPAIGTTPAASAPPTATRPPGSAPPAPTRAPASPTAGGGAPAVPQPNGTIPAGWQVYRGPAALPVVVAYPPDWTVDDSLFPDQAIISINGPSGNDTVEIDGAAQQSGANIDVLRDEFFNKKTAFCDAKGIEMTATRPVSGVPFAVLGATCEQSSELFYLLVGSGVKGGDEWSIAMRTPYERHQVVVNDIFEPMLASVNIYAPFPR